MVSCGSAISSCGMCVPELGFLSVYCLWWCVCVIYCLLVVSDQGQVRSDDVCMLETWIFTVLFLERFGSWRMSTIVWINMRFGTEMSVQLLSPPFLLSTTFGRGITALLLQLYLRCGWYRPCTLACSTSHPTSKIEVLDLGCSVCCASCKRAIL